MKLKNIDDDNSKYKFVAKATQNVLELSDGSKKFHRLLWCFEELMLCL